MNYHSYIAILFAAVFFGKFMVMDSRILVVLLETDEIAYVNPFCKKQNAKITEENSHNTLGEDSNAFNLSFDTFCNAPFKFEIFNWEQPVISEEPRTYAYLTPSIPESIQDRYYPPPRA